MEWNLPVYCRGEHSCCTTVLLEKGMSQNFLVGTDQLCCIDKIRWHHQISDARAESRADSGDSAEPMTKMVRDDKLEASIEKILDKTLRSLHKDTVQL